MKFTKFVHAILGALQTTTAAVTGVAVAGVLGLTYITAPVNATLNASAFNTSTESISSGTLSLTLAVDSPSAGFTTAISSMVPGDTQYRFVTYTQAATNSTALSPTLQITDGASTLLTADSIRGLAVKVDNCTVAWTYSLGVSAAPTCSGTNTAVLATTPLVTLKSATALGAGFQLAASAVSHLAYTITLPAGINETTANGGTAAVTGSPLAVTTTSGTGSLATYTVASTAALTTGEQIVISGSTVAAYNGTYILTVGTGTTFTTTSAGTGASTGTTATLPSVQNLTSTITWTVSEAQRAGTSTNG